jgi:hypothetical protein
VKCQGSANPNDRLARNCKSGPAACLHVRYVDFCPNFEVIDLDKIEFETPTFKAWSGLSSNDGTGSNPLPARSDGLDNVDSGPDAAFYIQMGVIEQVSIRCWFKGRNSPILVAFVPFEDVGQDRSLVGVLTARPRLQSPAAGADFWVGDDEYLHVGMGADHGPDVAAVEHRARRIGGELTLKTE